MEAFAPPETETRRADFGVIVTAGVYRGMAEERRRAVAVLAGVPYERAQAAAARGLPVTLWTTADLLACARRVALFQDVAVVGAQTASPPPATSVLGLVVVGVLVGAFGLLDPELEMYLWMGPVVVLGGFAWAWRRRSLHAALGASCAALGPPEPLPADVIGTATSWAADRRPWEAVSLLARAVAEEAPGSDREAEMLRAVAAIQEAAGRPVLAQNVLRRALSRRPKDEEIRRELARLMTTQGAPPAARPAEAPAPVTSGEPPWRYQGKVAVPARRAVRWPDFCPLCDRPAPHAVRLRLTRDEAVWIPFLGILGFVATGLASRTSVGSTVHFCGKHRAKHVAGNVGAVLLPFLIVITLLIAGAKASLAAIGAALLGLPLWFVAMSWRSALEATSGNAAMFVVRGACPAFVERLPHPPPEVVLPGP